MPRWLLGCALLLGCLVRGVAQGPALTADAIMARVAENQDRAEAARTRLVYVQHARVQSRKGGTVMCEEITDTRVVPSATGQTKTLLAISGHVRDGKRVIHYTALPHETGAKSAAGEKARWG